MSACYLPTHEWARQDGDAIVIGLSAFAAGEIGEVIHVQLPALGTTVSRGKPCAEIESVKSVNDFYSPIDGEVVQINAELVDHPETLNADAVGKGWFARIRPSAPRPLEGLLSQEQYQAQLAR